MSKGGLLRDNELAASQSKRATQKATQGNLNSGLLRETLIAGSSYVIRPSGLTSIPA